MPDVGAQRGWFVGGAAAGLWLRIVAAATERPMTGETAEDSRVHPPTLTDAGLLGLGRLEALDLGHLIDQIQELTTSSSPSPG